MEKPEKRKAEELFDKIFAAGIECKTCKQATWYVDQDTGERDRDCFNTNARECPGVEKEGL